jgi:protein subunit release factor A
MKRTIEIRAAEGGDDSKLFVQDLAQAYKKFAERKG